MTIRNHTCWSDNGSLHGEENVEDKYGIKYVRHSEENFSQHTASVTKARVKVSECSLCGGLYLCNMTL